MPRWLWFLPLGLVVVYGALQAFRLGWIAANLTETEAISAYAARYAREAGPGARAAQCYAKPGDDVWLVIRCGPSGAAWEYRVNRFGGLVGMLRPGQGIPQGRPET